MTKTYAGSCHCGAARFEAEIDLSAGTFKCNCSICTKTRMWVAFVKPDQFRLLSGESDLHDYQPYHVHHVFCQQCGVRPFSWGEDSSPEGKFYAVRLGCLDGVDDRELAEAPVNYFNGRHDQYDTAPAETRHL
jgi:hypothetical protein